MSTTRVQLSFSTYDTNSTMLSSSEDFNLSFTVQDESLGTIFEKFEVMLIAMGFVLDGKELRLEDKEETDYQAGTLLVEDFGHSFTTIPGGKS